MSKSDDDAPDSPKLQPSKLDRETLIAMTRGMANNQSTRALKRSKIKVKKFPEKTDFSTLEGYETIVNHRAVADYVGVRNPYFMLHEGRAGPTTIIEGREFINFASYDYLGLNATQEVAQAAKDAIDMYGTSVSASRPTAGNRPLHHTLEQQLADLYKAESALVFVSGHATNVSIIGDLMGPSDLVLFDALCHNSITVGAKLSGATRRGFEHNNLEDLEKVLVQSRRKHDRVLIVVEGLYSMDGDMPELARLIELKDRHSAWLMVDEAHSLGTLGASGLGVFEQQNIDPRSVDIWMGTLSKTLSSCGGYITGDEALIENMKFNASGFMFSVGMSPPVAGAASRALRLMLEQPERTARLQENGRFFLNTAKKAGLDTGLSAGISIVPVIVGDSLKTVRLSNLLLEREIYATPVTYPSVGQKEARLRFFITSEHTRPQIHLVIEETAAILKKLTDDNYGLTKGKGEGDNPDGGPA